jgi:hypothetical protein
MSLRHANIAIVVALYLALPQAIFAQTNSNAGRIGLRAEVRSMLQLHAMSTEVTLGGVTSTIQSASPEVLIVKSRIEGNGEAQRIRIRVAVISNTRTFLFRAIAPLEEDGNSIEFVSTSDSLLSRSRPIAGQSDFAIALDQPVHSKSQPLVGEIEIEFAPMNLGETRQSQILLQIVHQ